MLAYAAQIAAVIRARFRAIVRARRAFGFVVGGIAVRETIRHDQINHIIGRDALEAVNRLGARRNRQLKGGHAAVGIRGATHQRAGFRIRTKLQPQKKIISARGRLRALDDDARKIAIDLVCVESAASE